MAVSLSASQVAVVNIALGVCKQLNAPPVAQLALIYAGMGESNLGDDAGTYSTGGVWQDGSSPNPSDTAAEANAFLTGKYGFGNGGAIALAARSSDPVAIANAVENNAVYEASGGNADTFVPGTADSYGPHIGGTAAGLAQAQAIVAQYGGGVSVPKGGTAGLGGTGTVAPSQGLTSQLTIGGVGNQDENYWVGMNRIASAVYWYLFSDMERLYYMDGADLISQTPAAYINRVRDAENIQRFSMVFDNTSYQWASDHRRKGRVQHHTKLAKVTSPTEAQIDIVCVIDFYRGGDVVVLEGFGPGDGRWLVADCTRSVFSVFSSLTLVPPIMPLSEAEAAGTSGAAGKAAKAAGTSLIDPKTVVLSGSMRAKIVQVAQKAAAREASTSAYSYAEVRPYPGSLFGAAPVVTDCSGFATLCYKEAGAPDPNNLGFNGSGYTGTLEANGQPTSNPQPGDLCFWSSPDHVAVYIGGGNIIEFGGNPGPGPSTVSAESGYHAAFLGYRSYLP